MVNSQVMGHIEITPAGTHRAQWRDSNGRKHSKVFKRPQDAKNHLKVMEGDVQRGEFFDRSSGRIPFQDWAAECLAASFNIEPSTKTMYEKDLRHINAVLGPVLIVNLKDHDINTYMAGRLMEGASPTIVAREFRTIRKCMNRAVQKDRIRKSPCSGVTPPAPVEREMMFLTLPQLLRLSEAITPHYKAWVLMMGTCGLRWSESVGLRVGDVNLLRRRMNVNRQLIQLDDGTWQDKKLKTLASKRSLTVPIFVCNAIGRHLHGRDITPDSLVFTNRSGGAIGSSSFTKNTFKPALDRVGISSDFRIHDLRHTAVALAVQEGAHPKAIQRRMGHNSITVTLDRYGHLFPELDEELADRLDESMAALG
jgi:integrase